VVIRNLISNNVCLVPVLRAEVEAPTAMMDYPESLLQVIYKRSGLFLDISWDLRTQLVEIVKKASLMEAEDTK
jgi:hypothetical protein